VRIIHVNNPKQEPLPEVTCAYCGKREGRINRIAIGKPGSLVITEVLLHPQCEKGYVRMLDD